MSKKLLQPRPWFLITSDGFIPSGVVEGFHLIDSGHALSKSDQEANYVWEDIIVWLRDNAPNRAIYSVMTDIQIIFLDEELAVMFKLIYPNYKMVDDVKTYTD